MGKVILAIGALALVPASPPEAFTLEPVTQDWASEQADETVCRDRIHEVREANGHPPLQRETAHPDQPYLIAAVDQRIGGCSVMVMHADTADVRPLPKPAERPGLLPAR